MNEPSTQDVSAIDVPLTAQEIKAQGKRIQMETVWDTRYALSTGIEEVALVGVDGTQAKVQRTTSTSRWDLLEHGEWYTTKALAMAHAEKRRDARIASLRKQLARLETQSIIIRELLR